MSESAISAQQLLQAGKLGEALRAAEQELVDNPQDVDTLYCKAVAQRYLDRAGDALQTLEELKAINPHYARAFQEAGHNHKHLGNLDRAREAYQHAVDLNRALIASWRELVAIYEQQEARQAYAAARAEYDRLSILPPELVTVTSLIQENKLYRAERLCRDFLQKTPHHIEAMRLLAILGMRLFVYDDAEFLLESCVELQPDYWLARLDYVKVLHKRQKFEKALEQAIILRDRFPGNYVFDLTFANQSVAIGNFEEALRVYDKVIAANPDFDQTFVSRGHALKTIGRIDEGIESYRAAYQVRPDYGDAYWSLANLKTYRFTDEEIAQMRAQIERSETPADDRFHLCFALGKALEDREQYEESFACYVKGNLHSRAV